MKLKDQAKALYKRHLKLVMPEGWQSEKQMIMYRQEATMNAIIEALEMNQTSSEEEE